MSLSRMMDGSKGKLLTKQYTEGVIATRAVLAVAQSV